MSEEDWNSFQRGLDCIHSSLGEKKQKLKMHKAKISDDDLFKHTLLPSISQIVNDMEKREMHAKLSINVQFKIITQFAGFNIEDILQEHVKIVTLEEGLQSLKLMAQYSRGLLYIELVNNLASKGQCIKDFLQKGNMLNVAYITVLRYMTLANMILKYPRLLLCKLSFSQILKHKQRLLNFLESEEGEDLSSKLSLPFEIVVQDKQLNIAQPEMDTLKLTFNTDADWQQRDTMDNGKDIKVSDECLQKWVKSRKEEYEEADLERTLLVNIITFVC